MQRVGPQLGAYLAHGTLVGDHLLAGGHVDPVVAGVLDRRSRDPQVDLGGPGLAQHLHDLPGGVAAHDRVVDHDESLTLDDLRERIELQPQSVLAELLAGLDERPRDVAVLDEAVVLGQAGCPRQSPGGGVAGVRDRNHDIRLHRRLAPEDLAHLGARDLEHGAAHPRVGASEVDVLEHAERAPLITADDPGTEAVLGQRDHLAGLNVAQVAGADQIERARLAGHAVRGPPVLLLDHSQGQRSQPVRIAERHHRLIGHDHGRERSPQPGHDVSDGVLDSARLMAREQGGDDLRVRGRGERNLLVA